MDPDSRVEKALFRLLHYFNLLEDNVGLCISHLQNPDEPNASYRSLVKMTAERKIEHLKTLFAEDKDIGAGEKARNEFNRWYEKTKQARALRNRYIHGRWQYIPLRDEKPVGYAAPVWCREKTGSNPK